MVAEQMEFMRNALDNALGMSDDELGAKWDSQTLLYQMAMSAEDLEKDVKFIKNHIKN